MAASNQTEIELKDGRIRHKLLLSRRQKGDRLLFLSAQEYTTEKQFRRKVDEKDPMVGSTGPKKLSGMQKQVLGLYRGFLRAARTKSPEDRHQIESVVTAEFRRNSALVERKNFLYIEYLLRRGKKQLQQLQSPDTVGLSHLNVDFSQTKKS
ncbi:hypothetical protein LOK49_LG12G00093 [Camellia lanceoleosa]|uniref:Uncharacterized protein n=1 Tax=Camellia lanceoleosa TaxID=1840588 RepID=A0ACC0FS09_9ERIC|nr:hypothetical protein LOK49_LG12G00093 [Camellia lanceoleosa]